MNIDIEFENITEELCDIFGSLNNEEKEIIIKNLKDITLFWRY